MKRWIGLMGAVFAVAAVAPTTPLAAQERTKRSAHQFLEQMWSDRAGQVRVARFSANSDDTTDNSISDRQIGYVGDGCRAQLSSRAPHLGYVHTEVDWSRVSQVDRPAQNQQYVRVYGGTGAHSMVGFTFPSEADAARVETAMEFLRQECARASAF